MEGNVHRPGACWLTTNRACNIRCKWCYAKDTGFVAGDDMPVETAKTIVDICADGGIRGIILLGGEPTIYPHIFDVVSYCAQNGISTTLVTNGIVFSDKSEIQKYKDAGLTKVGLSIKTYSREAYKELTGADAFDKVLAAIENLASLEMKFGVSMVLTGGNMPQFIDGLKLAKERGAKSFGLSFCYNFCSVEGGEKEHLSLNDPYILARKFEALYPELKEALKGVYFSLEQSLPQCVWNQDFIKRLEREKHIHSICQLMSGTGILFDTQGNLIPCNAMHTIKYGKLGVDFTDWESLRAYLDTPEVLDMFSLLRGAPDEKCLSCEMGRTCGGGCVTNWTNYSFDELMAMKPKD